MQNDEPKGDRQGEARPAAKPETGIAQPILHRFLAGERDLRLATVDRLAAYLRSMLKPDE